MAILSDTFGGFSLSSQQGKLASTRVLRGVSDTRLPGKLTSSRVVKEVYHDLKPIKIEKFFTSAISINDNNQVGKLTSTGLLKGIQDVTTVSKITTLPSNFYQFVDYFASDIKSFGKLKSAHTVKGLISDNNVKTYSKLSRFSPTNNPSDYTVNVIGQSLDTTTDVYTIDSIFLENNPTSSYLWTKESPTSSSNKTLYFVNQLNIKFEVGETVRIRNVNANYSELVTVIASTSSSITYSSNNLLPEISGTFIDSGSTLYERRYFNALDATNSMQRYALSVIAPGLKGVAYPYQEAREFPDKLKTIPKIDSSYGRITYNESTASNEFKNYIFSIIAPGLKGVAYPYQEARSFSDTNTNLSTINKLKIGSNGIAGEFPDKLKTIPKIDSSYGRITYDELTASNEFKNYIFSIIAPGLKGVAYPYQEARSFSDININLGIINKLKTGDFKIGSNGIQDPATIKKAPVQFWS